MPEFTAQEKFKLMSATAKQLQDLIHKRLQSRMEVVKAMEIKNPLDVTELPKEVQQMREIELTRIRAVMQEQMDLIEIIKIMYPDA